MALLDRFRRSSCSEREEIDSTLRRQAVSAAHLLNALERHEHAGHVLGDEDDWAMGVARRLTQSSDSDSLDTRRELADDAAVALDQLRHTNSVLSRTRTPITRLIIDAQPAEDTAGLLITAQLVVEDPTGHQVATSPELVVGEAREASEDLAGALAEAALEHLIAALEPHAVLTAAHVAAGQRRYVFG